MSFLRTIVLGTLLTAPMLTSAAVTTPSNILNPGTFNLGLLTDASDANFGANVAFGNGTFTDSWTFSVSSSSDIAASLTSTSVRATSTIGNLSAYVDTPANVLTLDFSGPTQKGGLSQNFSGSFTGTVGLHTLFITGNQPTSKNGSYSATISVAPVPVPAAAWLMGSAMVGLVSFGRRKIGLAA